MSYDRPSWAAQSEMPPQMPEHKRVNIDVNEFVRTRDALTSAYLGLSAQVDRAVKAYLDHTQVVLSGDATLNVSTLLQPFNILTQYAQGAQLALQQNGGIPMPVGSEEPAADGKKKRKKRAYKQRDPNAPKRPLTAYFRYLGEKRAEIQQDMAANPEKYQATGKPGDITKIATDMWNALSKDQQEPYRQAYQAALKDYEIDVAAYKASGGKTETLDETKDELDADGQLQAEAAAEVDDSSDSDSDTESEEEEVAPPPKKTPKSALKKSKPAAAAPVPAPALHSIHAAPAASSSPERKRKSSDADEGGKKKRSRKGDKVVAGSDPTPAATAPVASSPVPAAESSKKKKDKKKKGGV